MFKKQKGQGALEYLLLIGGAVLIAVIVIALLVGMGGQSRKTAQDQGESAKDALDVPQAAYITYLTAKNTDCYTDEDERSKITFSWNPVGTGGTHKLYIKNSLNNFLKYTDNSNEYEGNDPTEVKVLDPLNTSVTDVEVNIYSGYDLDSGGNIEKNTKCGDTYYAYIETTKNNQTVRSELYRFGWTE